jgi:hypothetical protein
MAETLNVNVLVAAKEEYTKQLISTIQGGIYDIIKQIYTESQKNNIRRLVSYSNFQKELKAVPNWTSFKLDEKLHSISSKYLMDLVTAIFVSHVKILACVRLKSDDKSVKIKVPNLNTFLHKIIINCSECIYYTPDIIEDNKTKIFEIINASINETISNQIPIEYILNEYLSGVFDEEEPAYPDNEDVVEQEPDLNEYSDEEVDDDADVKKNIPIIPIQNPISKKIEPGTLKDELPFNKLEEDLDPDPEPDPEIEDFKDLKNKKDNAFKINKQEEIEDDSEEEVSDDEDDKKEPTLF